MKAKVWDEGKGEEWQEVPIPAELEAQAEEWRAKLLDVVATEDDDLMEKYLADEELTAEDIHRAIRKGTLAFSFVPVLCGSAFKNKGVQPMLDAVVDFLPSPARHPAGHRPRPQGHRGARAPGRREGAVRRASPSRSWPTRSAS